MYLILLFILIYSVSRFYDLTFLSACKGCELWRYLTFHFVHVSFFHLAVNSFAIYLYWKALRQASNIKYALPVIAASSLAAGYLSATDIPTIGSSAIAFSMIAVYCVLLFFKKGPKDGQTLKLYIVLAAFAIIQSIFYTGINVKIHALSFLFAAFLSFLFRRKLFYGL
ncbi:MAG: rhomboid family intramembrane serine protease [Tannerellaceae bacterium]|jgi:membrane associated rhomboid family serine protease|nr:rhomboid family intramembrane serine protease [Tannerellaceae bacterium]